MMSAVKSPKFLWFLKVPKIPTSTDTVINFDDVANYSINNRSLTKMSPDELLKWRDYYKAEVLRDKRIERAKSGQGSGNQVLVRF